MYVLRGFVIFTCLEASCSVSYAGVNLDRLQRYGNLSIYIRISGSSSAHWQKPPPLCSCAAHVPQHPNAQGPSVHTGGGRGGGCYILEKHHIIYPTPKFSHYFYPRKTQPAPSALFAAPVPAGVLCSAKLHVAAIVQGPEWLGRGRAGDTTREAFGAAAPSGDGESGRAGGSVPTLGCPDVAEPSRA